MNEADRALVDQLIARNEAAFTAVVSRLHRRLVSMAQRVGVDRQIAEDVAQDTWRAVLRSIASFDGRSRLDTWIIQIAIHRARTLRTRGRRELPFSSLEDDGDPLEGLFTASGRWRAWLPVWPRSPEASAADQQMVRFVSDALDALPETQRLVVAMRDVEGLDAATTCEALEISEANQRVLLHRGRARIRAIVAERLVPRSEARTSP